MTAANAMMRLMSEKGTESQQDRYARIKAQGLNVFEKEMIDNGIPEDMRIILHNSCDKYYGCCAIQEQMMMLLMDCAHFTLAEANQARKIVAKKQMEKIPELRAQVLGRFSNNKIGQYFWRIAVEP
jgi:DNA polymerase III alpha subunit